jgi:superfamily II DNA helicase RecQ
MSVETRLLTLQLDPRTGLFDDSPLRQYLAARELIKMESQFHVWAGRPAWSVLVVARALTEPAGKPLPAKGPPAKAPAARDASPQVRNDPLNPLAKAIYDRLRSWRRQRAHDEGVPSYVILTNAQAQALARDRPTTLAGVSAIDGLGKKRLAKHGHAILEVLHGAEPQGGTKRSSLVREVDGDEPVVVREDAANAEVSAPQPDAADRDADADNS